LNKHTNQPTVKGEPPATSVDLSPNKATTQMAFRHLLTN
jgi:hypothetical protein